MYVLIAPSRAGCSLRELLSFFIFDWLVLIYGFFFYYLVCDVSYLKEPFPYVQCNPYAAGSLFSLQCQVQALASVGPRLEILWFFTNTSDDTVQISAATLTSFRSIVNQTEMGGQLLTSTINFGPFTNPIHAGGYFCRVALDGNTASFSASTAQVFDTETDAVLSSQPCGGQGLSHTQSDDIMKCAGNISYPTTSGLTTVSTAEVPTSSTITSTTPPPPPSSSSPPTSDASLGSSVGGTTISQPQTGRPALSLWVYVLVGVAAVFAMIIIVLTILCIGLCLKKNKTTDSFKREFSLVSLFRKIIIEKLIRRFEVGALLSDSYLKC